MLKNGLYIVSTPIGNLGDISARAIETLENTDIVACEDTRVSKKLFALLGLKTDKKFICYEDHREEQVAHQIVNMIKQGQSVALISDAGAPLISDPGYKLVALCHDAGLFVTVVPGASAVISALQLSGLPTNRFMFAGFIPNREQARLNLFSELQGIQSTLVFFETAPRLIKSLQVMAKVFGARKIAVVREITKIYEQVLSGSADTLIASFEKTPPKGEIVLTVAPPEPQETKVDIDAELKKRLATMKLSDAVKDVASLCKMKKNEVYKKALELQNE